MPRTLLAIIAVVSVFPSTSVAQETPVAQSTVEPSAVQAANAAGDPIAELSAVLDSYLSNFNRRDAKGLAQLWTTDGVYSDRSTGDQIVGKEAIESEFENVFSSERSPTLRVETEALDFVSPNVALERGTATATRPDGEILQSAYSVVYVKHDGRWLIDRVTEEEVVDGNPGQAALGQLEWLVGDWIDEQEGITIELTCRWTQNQAYLSRIYKVIVDNEVHSSGLQIIGWDPSSEQIRSWLFDSGGTFISGQWTSRDGKWIVQSIATLADGGRGSFTSVFRPTEDGNYTFEKINQVLDGQLLPNADEAVVRRK